MYPALILPHIKGPVWPAADHDRRRTDLADLIITMSSPGPSPRRSHLKVTRSTSNLRIPPVSSTTGSSLAHNTEALASSSSSINNVEMYDRILVPEPEADADTAIEHQTAVGQMDGTADDEESKENLRAKLRNTLSRKQSLPGTFFCLGVAVPLSRSCFVGRRCFSSAFL